MNLAREDFHLQLLWNAVAEFSIHESRHRALPPVIRTVTLQSVRNDDQSCGSDKFEGLLDRCFADSPDRILAAVFCILEIQDMTTLGVVKLYLADWVARKISKESNNNNNGESESREKASATRDAHVTDTDSIENRKPINMADGLPPFIPLIFRSLLVTGKDGKDVLEIKRTDVLEIKRIIEKPGLHASKISGLLRTKWVLNELGLGIFIPLLPECPLLCVYCLYYYLTPILMRPHPVQLHSQTQIDIFMKLSQYPKIQIPTAYAADGKKLDETQSMMAADTEDIATALHFSYSEAHRDEVSRANTRNPLLAAKLPASIHHLAQLVCRSFGFNYKPVLMTFIDKSLKYVDWNPKMVLKTVEKQLATK